MSNQEINVLYVEDSNTDALLLDLHIERYITADTLKVDVARTVAQGIEMFSARPYSAVLIDWNLPDGNGLEVAKHIRQSNAKITIVFITGSNVSEEQKLLAKQYQAKDFIRKEHDQSHIDRVRQLLSEPALPT